MEPKYNYNDLARIHEFREKVRAMGGTDEDALKLWKIAFETADRIVDKLSKGA